MNKLNKLNKLITLALVAAGIAACAAQARAEHTDDCITFSSANSFTLKANSKGWNGMLWTSTDKVNWTEWKGALVTAAQADGAYNLYVRGDAANTKIAGDYDYRWVLTGSNIACTGNIETLRGATGDQPSPTQMAESCYAYMFSECKSLTAAPALPATTLANACYRYMFLGCTSLTAAPALPATTLANACYGYMFQGCRSLTAAPALPATTLKDGCYASMFYGCTALTAAPALPAMTLVYQCYDNMFYECTSLTAAPALPATTLADDCYNSMFYECTSLTAAPALPATTLANACYEGMFCGCTSLLDIPVLPATELKDECYGSMFCGCTSLEVNKAPPGKEWKIPATEGDPGDFAEMMFEGTAGDLTGAPELNTTYYIASAPVPVTYLDAEGQEQTTNAIVVAASDKRVTWNAGWYVVTNEVTVKGGADCSGAVHLILADTGKLTISGVAQYKAGIAVSGTGNSLAIYGQKLGTGALTVTGADNCAGIGGEEEVSGSNITINGGTVTANGGCEGAGIGGGDGGDGSDITINGGTVTATGNMSGAGIGGGRSGAGSDITINGGKVTAQGGVSGSSGIGSGYGGKDPSKIKAADDVIVKAGAKANPTTEIAHLGDQDIASDLADKRYATAEFSPTEPIAFSVAAPAHATAAVYSNKVVDAQYKTDSIVWSNRAAKVVYTVDSDKDWYFKGDKGWAKAITNELDTTVNPAVDKNTLPAVVEVTCTREEVTGTKTLEEGFTYTAAPTDEDGGVFYLKTGATLTGTNVTFAGNGAMHGGAIGMDGGRLSLEGGTFESNKVEKLGGAIYNYGGNAALKGTAFTGNKSVQDGGAIYNNGTLSLDGVTFEGNEATGNGGAIANVKSKTVNFDGAVTLKTETDTIYNKGTLNWNLADGKQGLLNGYQNLTNDGSTAKLQLTVGDYPAYPTNFVIATGDFKNVANKDTFKIKPGDVKVTINGSGVATGTEPGNMLYRLVTEGTNLVLQVYEITCEREEVTGETTLEADATYTAAPTGKDGGAFKVSEGATLTGTDVTFADNEAAKNGGAIFNDQGTVALTNAVFTGNKAAQNGGAIHSGGTLSLDDVTFADNETTYNGGAINNNRGTVALTNAVFTGNKANFGGAIYNDKGTLSLDGVTFEGNKAKYGGAIVNYEGTLSLDGPVTLVTTNDTIFNGGTLNWNLADGKQGFLGGYDKLSSGGTLQLTVGDYAASTNFTIATGNFSGIATAKTDTFSITNVLGGAALPGAKINGDLVTSADGKTGYKLVTEEDLDAVPPTTNLVLKITQYTWTRKVVTTSLKNPEDVLSPYALTNGFTYTAKPTAKVGGAFNVNNGATLTGTNVTFVANESESFGGAIYNEIGTVVLKDASFTRNKAAQNGGAIHNFGTLSLGGVTFDGNTAPLCGAIGNVGTAHFDGAVTLVTETDTIFNGIGATLNWNLAGGKQGLLNGYQNITNANANAKLQLTVEENYAASTNFTIATGNFSNIKTAKTDTFSIKPLGKDVKIDGGTVASADESTGYRLVTEPAGATTNLVLKITLFTCKHTELEPGASTNLVEGTTYTAAPLTGKDGGAFNVNEGATLTGTDVIFEANEALDGGAIFNNGGTVALKDADFKRNKAQIVGGAILNSGMLSLDGVTFEGNEAAELGGAILNGGTVNFDGAVTLKTETDTIYNEGTLNWNLADGKQGFLGGYDKLTNKGTLQLTVEDYAATTNFTLATGDLSDTAGKDTFTIKPGDLTVKIDGDTVFSTDGWYGYKLETEEDLSVPTTNLVLKITKYTCVHTELESGDSTNLVAGVYTAAPTGNAGGVFNVKNGATLTGTDVVFADNEAYAGGAIYNDGGTVALKNADFKRNKAQTLCGAICNTGTLSLDGVTFEGNEAMDGGGAIGSMGTAHFDGAVTLRTASDTINNTGTLNWNLAGGKQGVLNGYQNITNDYSYAEYGLIPTLQLTVEDYQATTNFVIATGDFTDVEGKDTFLMTNVTGGVTATITIGGITQLNGTWWSLEVEKPLKLKKALKAAAAETSRLVLATVPAEELVQLTDVEIVDEKGATNATAVVKVGDTVVKQNPDGSYTVPKGYEITLEYQATDDYMFGPGWTTKTVVLEPLTKDLSMDDTGLKPSTQEKWVEVRKIAIDTRERIVVGSPNEVLPIAYSTNGWGWAEALGAYDPPYNVMLKVDGKLLLSTNQNGYAEWMPEVGAYGKYDVWQEWLTMGMSKGSTNATIYYSGYYPLTVDQPAEGGTVAAITNGVEATGTFDVLGFEYVTVVGKPADATWQLKEWSVTTNGADVALHYDDSALTNRFEMPCTGAVVTATFEISDAYRAEMAQAATNSYVATTNSIEALRLNRLTDEETDAALVKAKNSFDTAVGAIGDATKPYEGDAATNTLATALAKIQSDAKALSDGKPGDVVFATDFSANPPFEPVETNAFGEVTVFTWNDRVWTNGVNAFTTMTEFLTNAAHCAFATNLHVFGAQTITVEPKEILNTWNLDLVTYVDDEGAANAAVVTVGTDDNGELVNITNKLGQITGAGEIVLGKTRDNVDPSIYDDYIADKDKVGVVNTGVEPQKDPQSGKVTVDVDETAKTETTESGETAVVLPGIENASGDIVLTVERTATNDVVVAGNVQATGDVTISNGSTNEVTVAGTVSGTDVKILNGTTEGTGSLCLSKVVAAGDVTIVNTSHLEANVTAGGLIDIYNADAPQTLVGSYEGAEIKLCGSATSAISNVTFVSDGPVTMTGVNVLTGPFAITAPAGAVTNDGQLVWNVKGGNATATLADFDAITATAQAQTPEIWIDAAPADGVFTLAKNAAGADGQTFKIKGYGAAPDQTAVVNGPMLYPDAKAFELSLNAANELVLTISDGKFDITAKVVTPDAEAANKVDVPAEGVVGKAIAVKATLAEHYQFNGWTGVYGASGAALEFADAAAPETTFVMPVGAVTVTATFALSEAYRAEQLAAVTNAFAQARADIEAKADLTPDEKAALIAQMDKAEQVAKAAIAGAKVPAAVEAAVGFSAQAIGTVQDEAEKASERIVRFESATLTTTEGGELAVKVYGGSLNRSTAVTLSLVKNTYGKSPKAYVDGRRISFPITLNWAKGNREPITVVLKTSKSSKVDPDRFFTLELGSEAAIRMGAIGICTVTVKDAVAPGGEDYGYVRALAWPANGGKVSGAGYLKTEKAKVTLKAKANKWATFAGWYHACTNDANKVDLGRGPITLEKSLPVGYRGVVAEAGTYYAYFTNVLPVAAVNDPDVSAEGASGVWSEADGVYEGMAGVWFSLPVSMDDASGKGKLTVSYLPRGLRYNKQTGCIEGVPATACEKTAKVVAKNAAGKHAVNYTFVIAAMPAEAVGTWNGLVRSLADTNGLAHAGFGTVQFTAGATGKLSAKVTTRLTGTKSFSATGYELIDENTFGVTMATKKGEVFEATLSLTNDWTEAQLFGTVTGGAFEANGEECRFAAIKNAFDKKTGEAEAIELLKLFKGTYADTLFLREGGAEVGSVTFKVKDDGAVQVRAYSVNGTYSASCAGAFRILSAGKKDLAAVQAAIRSGKKLWACDATVKADSDGITGLACDYDSDGEDTHETIGVPANREKELEKPLEDLTDVSAVI